MLTLSDNIIIKYIHALANKLRFSFVKKEKIDKRTL
jgi:hypothetical protein